MEKFLLSPTKPPQQSIEMEYMRREPTGPKGKPRGFRAPQELDERLDMAEEITGKDMSTLVVECLLESLDKVVERLVLTERDDFAARQKAAREFFKQRKAA